MSGTLRRNMLALASGLCTAFPAIAQPPAAVQSPAVPPPPVAVRPADVPPPIVDLTPVDLPERNRGGPIDCVTCNNKPPAIITSIEYLIVKPRRTGNDYAIVDPRDDLTPEGSIRDGRYDTASALRAAVGYRPAGSDWEMLLMYTYLHAGADRSAAVPPGAVLYATQTRPGLVDNALFAQSGNSVTLNVYDLETGRHFRVDDSFNFRLGMSARLADLNQSMKTFYFGNQANGTFVGNRTCFEGAGLSAVGQGEWNVWRGIRFFGRARGSLLMGQFCNRLIETDNGGQTINADVTEKYYQTVPVLELASGVAWEYRNFRVAVGYELQNWFNVVDSPMFIDDFAEGKIGRRKSDLGIEGVFFQLGMAF